MDAMIGKDLEAIFADPFLTVAVSIGSASTRGILDQADELMQDGFGQQAQVRSTVVTIKKGALGAGLVVDATINIDGVNYKVREPALADDGLLQQIRAA